MDRAESDPFVRSGPFQGHIESPKPGPCVVFFLFSSEGHNSSPWASWGLNSQPLGATSNQVSAPLRHSTCLEKCCLCRCVLDLEYNYVLNTLAAVCFLSSWKTDFDSDFDVCRSCFLIPDVVVFKRQWVMHLKYLVMLMIKCLGVFAWHFFSASLIKWSYLLRLQAGMCSVHHQ